MSLAPPAYISSLQNNIRARPISWEGAVRAKTITEADLKKIKSIDKVRKEQRKQTIEGDISSFVTLFLGSNDAQGIFQAAAKREDIIQYLLVLIGDLMDGKEHCSNLEWPIVQLLMNRRHPIIHRSFDSALRPL
jgi:V-type H+-transporting ATPase subunit H